MSYNCRRTPSKCKRNSKNSLKQASIVSKKVIYKLANSLRSKKLIKQSSDQKLCMNCSFSSGENSAAVFKTKLPRSSMITKFRWPARNLSTTKNLTAKRQQLIRTLKNSLRKLSAIFI